MNTTALIRPPSASGRAARRSEAGHDAAPSASDHPTFGAMLGELIPLVDAIAGYGPPVIFLAGPWLLLGLMLSGPFALLVILVVFMVVAATVVVALSAAIFVVPYLAVRGVRGLRGHRARRALSHDHAVQVIPVESPRVVT
jgi:hypothetical protein